MLPVAHQFVQGGPELHVSRPLWAKHGRGGRVHARLGNRIVHLGVGGGSRGRPSGTPRGGPLGRLPLPADLRAGSRWQGSSRRRTPLNRVWEPAGPRAAGCNQSGSEAGRRRVLIGHPASRGAEVRLAPLKELIVCTRVTGQARREETEGALSGEVWFPWSSACISEAKTPVPPTPPRCLDFLVYVYICIFVYYKLWSNTHE